MSKLNLLAVVVLSVALSGAAYAARGGGHGGGGHGGGGHGGGGHVGGGHFGGGHVGGARVGGFRGGGGRHFSTGRAISRSAGRAGFQSSRSSAGGNAAAGMAGRNASVRSTGRSTAVRAALVSGAVAGALHNTGALHNPGARAQITASAATAGWHNRRGGGWWRHGNGGYGWVGPLFWPFAYYDMYDYAMWGDGNDPSFWGYGYNDIYAGLFAPYGYDELAGYLPPGASSAAGAAPAANPAPDELSQMCGEDSRDIAGLPIDRIQQALQPNDTQRAALDDLANASVKAAQSIKAACPSQITLTAPGRLAAMQARIEAMIAAVGTVQPPLEKFYDLLSDEQKARLNALGQDQREDQRSQASAKTGGSLAQSCATAQPAALDWPAAEIETRLHPTDAQRASLTALKDASAKAADMLKGACQPDSALTPPARLAAVGKRLDTMLGAVETVRAALDDLYSDLSDEQKAQFEAIGPGRAGTASSDDSTSASRHYRRHHASLGGIVRRLISIAW